MEVLRNLPAKLRLYAEGQEPFEGRIVSCFD